MSAFLRRLLLLLGDTEQEWMVGPVGDQAAWRDVSCTFCQREGHREDGCPDAADWEREREWLQGYYYQL